MKNKLNWDLNWKFCEGYSDDAIKKGIFTGMEDICLPHQVKTLTYNYFSHDDTQIYSTYGKEFELSSEQLQKRHILEFDGVMTYFDLYVNGKPAGSHKGGYSRFRFDISKYLVEGSNYVTVAVDSHERDDIPPFGCVIDYMTFGGIYRDVNFYELKDAFATDILFRYDMTGENSALVYPELYLDNAGAAFHAVVSCKIVDAEGKEVASFSQETEIESGASHFQMSKAAVSGLKRWDPTDPNMYIVKAEIKKDGELIDTIQDDIGFRTLKCTTEGLMVNGRRITVVGMDRHQSYPYIGYSIGKRAQMADADLLKKYGLNTVRTSHYMQSQYFLDECDKIGLLVFEEIPGWQHLGGEEFRKVVMNDVRSMIVTDFNHPGIFIWGVRLNESLDDDELYTKTNALAHQLDPSRSTGGVRYLKKSHLLEDVYTMNDFCHAQDVGLKHILFNQHQVTGLSKNVPYIVTEYMGHTYPTKQFDNELRLDEHVRRHAEILGRSLIKKDSMGAIGWCAFDYNTHGDYGAGDKICYHGIFDMFRIPKYAAYVYRSQKSPKEEIIMQPATAFARGEKDIYGIMPFLVMTNCDYIEVFMYGRSLGKFFPSDLFFGLPHPPIEVKVDVDSLWNAVWPDGKIVGYIDDKPVSEYKFVRDPHLAGFTVKQDDDTLSTAQLDTTRFELSFVDQLGHPCRFYNGVFQIEAEGDIEVIGPKYLAPAGGRIAFWVRTKPTMKDGTAYVTVKTPALPYKDQTFRINLVKDPF